MAAISKTSVKSTLEFGDTPTSASMGDLIDSFQLTDGLLTAISTAAQGGQTGVLIIEATAQVTTRAVGAGVIAFLAAATTAAARNALELGILATANTVALNQVPNRPSGSIFVFNANGSAATLSGAENSLFVSRGSGAAVFETFASAAVTASVSLTGTITLATTADTLSATSTERIPTVATMLAHPGIVKAWIHFSGSGGTIFDSFNIATLAANGVGFNHITFTTPFASSSYSATGLVRAASDIASQWMCLRATVGFQTAAGVKTVVQTLADVEAEAESYILFIGDQ